MVSKGIWNDLWIKYYFSSLINYRNLLLLKSSKMGYEISVVGEGVDTANYAGVNVKK